MVRGGSILALLTVGEYDKYLARRWVRPGIVAIWPRAGETRPGEAAGKRVGDPSSAMKVAFALLRSTLFFGSARCFSASPGCRFC